jgi:hypothetical protein
VAAEVVHHDNVAAPQMGRQKFAAPGQEADGVDRLIKHAGGDDAITA